jgi:IPT/TIG domain-containing protein
MRTSGIAVVVGFLFAALCAPLAAQTYPMPFVNNPLVPAATPPTPLGGPGFMLTVNGAGFVNGSGSVPGSVVKWNGSPRATTFVSATQLTAAILSFRLQPLQRVLYLLEQIIAI